MSAARRMPAAFAVVAVLASATCCMGFPINTWGNNPKYTPISSNVNWILPDVLWDNPEYMGNAIALVFVNPVFSDSTGGITPINDVSVSFDTQGSPILVNNGPGAQTPVLMDAARLDSSYFSTAPDGSHYREKAKIEFCEFPENGSQGTPILYVDLHPSGENTGIWDIYPNVTYGNGDTAVEFDVGEAAGMGSVINPIYFWFTVFIFDDPNVNNATGYAAYDMLFEFTATTSGNKLVTIDFSFKEFVNIEQIPEPSALLLLGAGAAVLGLRRRRVK